MFSHKRNVVVGLGIVLLLLLLGGVWVWQYLRGSTGETSATPFASYVQESTVSLLDLGTANGERQPGEALVAGVAEYQPLQNYTLERFVEGLEVPWSIVFTSPERVLVTERPGRVREVKNGVMTPAPLLTLTDVSAGSEEGLMGLALDPAYEDNKLLYLSYAYMDSNEMKVKVVRYKDTGVQLTEPTVVIDDIPAARNHAGSRLRFAPDGTLFITTGDALDRNLAQDMNSLAGKVLRLNADGSIPNDNPFPDSPIFSFGHRNPQGIDFHPVTGTIVTTEHGPSGFDGPGGGDEVNVIEAGKNYGWPVVSHDKTAEGFVPPLLVYTPALAPASGTFYTGSLMPELAGSYLFGGLRGQGLFRVWFDPSDPWKTARYDQFDEVAVGRVRDVVTGPDGAIYFSSSNRDGRGAVKQGDDVIYRLVPAD